MELTVGSLKEILNTLEDDVVLGTLNNGNDDFRSFLNIKRLLLLKGGTLWANKTFLAINGMGSHFTGIGGQAGLKIIGTFDGSDK